MPLQQFPSEFPVEALPVLAAYLRKTSSTRDAANAAWNVVGWAGNSFLAQNPQPQLTGAAQMAVAKGDEEVAKLFEDAHRQFQAAGTPEAQKALFGGGQLISIIGPLLVQVAKRMIDQWLGGAAS